LAALAAPGAAAANPDRAWNVHVHGTLNIAHAILDELPDCWLIHVGSGLVYGESARSGLPLDETALLAPIDDYGVTKAAADLALGALSYRGLKVIRMRSTTLELGSPMLSSFQHSRRKSRIEASLTPAVIRVENLDAERDFLDLRDVASAYALGGRRQRDNLERKLAKILDDCRRRMSSVGSAQSK